MNVIDTSFLASDGFELAATIWDTDPSRILLIAPATGVKRSLYRRFAEFVAGRGFSVLTWDWRGTGGSRPANLRGFRGSMRTWADLDLAAAFASASTRWPQARLFALGHSFGGQAIGLVEAASRLDGLVTVAAQSGYWGLWPFPRRFLYAALWHLLLPASTHFCGYFPAKRLGFGEDLPKEVALEWARWCRRPNYLGDYSGHARLQAPILSWSFADDNFAPQRAVDALHDRYSSSHQDRRHLVPAEHGLPSIGHFGFFRPTAESLWLETLAWLEKR